MAGVVRPAEPLTQHGDVKDNSSKYEMLRTAMGVEKVPNLKESAVAEIRPTDSRTVPWIDLFNSMISNGYEHPWIRDGQSLASEYASVLMGCVHSDSESEIDVSNWTDEEILCMSGFVTFMYMAMKGDITTSQVSSKLKALFGQMGREATIGSRAKVSKAASELMKFNCYTKMLSGAPSIKAAIAMSFCRAEGNYRIPCMSVMYMSLADQGLKTLAWVQNYIIGPCIVNVSCPLIYNEVENAIGIDMAIRSLPKENKALFVYLYNEDTKRATSSSNYKTLYHAAVLIHNNYANATFAVPQSENVIAKAAESIYKEATKKRTKVTL